MAGPVVLDPEKAGRRRPQFGNATQADVPGFLGIMQIVHSEPTASAFARLLTKQQRQEDEVQLAHLFEEIATLALHGLITEDLVFDAFAVDLYWEQLQDAVEQVRRTSGNAKFGENFEIAAALAGSYREERPAKVKA